MGKNMLIGQSGGPTAAINASLAGAVREAMGNSAIGEIYGMVYGLEGVMNRQIIDLRAQLTTQEHFRRLIGTPCMALGSCRLKIKDNNREEVFNGIMKILRDLDVGYFFYNGGNDSMDTVNQLSEYLIEHGEDIKCVGIPKTIDNDLMCTDHTPGFGSAARYVSTTMKEIICDAYSYNIPTVVIVEIMGRNAGWLTASSVLARSGPGTAPHLIYLPEAPFDPDDFINKALRHQKSNPNVIVAVSEGIKYADGEYVAAAKPGMVDAFGHQYRDSVGIQLENLVRERMGCKTRRIELSVLQRSASHLSAAIDLREAYNVGSIAVKYALEGKTAVMVAIKRISDSPYLVKYEPVPAKDVANHERTVPAKWITGGGSNVSQQMIDYLTPLVQPDLTGTNHEELPFLILDRTASVL